MAADLTWREAIEKVLASSSTPLHYNEITQQIITDGLRSSLGATPSATVNAHISASIKHEGRQSPYLRVAKGTFTLAKNANANQPIITSKLTPTVDESDDIEDQYDIVTSFGMYWRRNAVEWGPTTKLLGKEARINNMINYFFRGRME